MAEREMVIVDGANIAYEAQTRKGKPRVANIVGWWKSLRACLDKERHPDTLGA